MEQLFRFLVQGETDKIITIAIVCLSASVAWATFGLAYREKYLQIYTEKINTFKKLISELEYIGIWASGQYDKASHSESWYDPRWRVRDFPFEEIQNFTWEKRTAVFGEKIFEKLNRLQKAIIVFYGYLNNHGDLVKQNRTSLVSIGQKMDHEGLRTNKQVINPLNIKGVDELSTDEKAFVQKVYEINKCIHVEGIGNKDTSGLLYSTFKEADDHLRDSLSKLRKSRLQSFLRQGITFLSIVVALIGIVFLFLFLYRIVPLFYQFVCGRFSQ